MQYETAYSLICAAIAAAQDAAAKSANPDTKYKLMSIRIALEKERNELVAAKLHQSDAQYKIVSAELAHVKQAVEQVEKDEKSFGEAVDTVAKIAALLAKIISVL